MRRPPFGFYLAALCAGGFGALMVRALLELDASRGGGPRLCAALLAALSAVAAEALWRARPWAFRASVTLAVTAALLGASAMVAMRDPFVLAGALVLAAAGMIVVIPMLAYIHHRSRQLWPARGVRVPAPRP